MGGGWVFGVFVKFSFFLNTLYQGIKIAGHPSRGFDGYVDKKATEKKIVHNVLRKGDMYFR